jgi:NAD(P)-dependent dehydrogenase (short-subunit alcohol dehydrogenase family)
MSKVMLVTGASRGIGAAIARQAARAGYRVCVNYLRSADAANALVGDIQRAGGDAVAVQADVAREADVVALFDAVDRRFGTLDVLVNNAGILGKRLVRDMDEATLHEMFAANVFSVFFCAREAVRRMQARGTGGVIVNMSSVASRLGGLAGGTHYAASKGALDSFTLALAKEVGRDGIRVNAVRPGLIETEIHAIHGGIDPALAAAVPLGRGGLPDEVAAMVLWLASDAASYVHGAVLDVSGGR